MWNRQDMHFPPYKQDVNWTYMRRSEDVLICVQFMSRVQMVKILEKFELKFPVLKFYYECKFVFNSFMM